MPQKLSVVCDDPGNIVLSPDFFIDRPDVAQLVARIVSTWASIEHQLGMTLMRMLGTKEPVALAMFARLQSPSIQKAALDAAAKAAYADNDEGFKVYSAVAAATYSAGKKRHKIAHWLWGKCVNLPDAFLLADPDALSDHEKRWFEERDGIHQDELKTPEDARMAMARMRLDHARILVYKIADLERDLADLQEIGKIMFWYRQYLQPVLPEGFSPFGRRTASEALRQLSSLRLYQEARDRLEKDKNSSPESQP